MKVTITGQRYDTDSGTLLGRAKSAPGAEVGSVWEAALYRTPRGKRFFLAGRGGWMTRFTDHGRVTICPLTRDEARTWAEQYLEKAEVEAAFGEAKLIKSAEAAS